MAKKFKLDDQEINWGAKVLAYDPNHQGDGERQRVWLRSEMWADADLESYGIETEVIEDVPPTQAEAVAEANKYISGLVDTIYPNGMKIQLLSERENLRDKKQAGETISEARLAALETVSKLASDMIASAAAVVPSIMAGNPDYSPLDAIFEAHTPVPLSGGA